MKALATCLGSFMLAGSLAADELHVVMPISLAARVQAGERAGALVTVEPHEGKALVTVSRSLRALSDAPSVGEIALAGVPSPDSTAVPAGFAAPAELTRRVNRGGSSHEALASVVEYVSRTVTLDETDKGPQDAGSVLVRRRARCSGRANLAVGLLRTLGLPARVVHGIVVGDRSAVWHRWGEAWLGHLGWVAFDPGAAVGVVNVRYIPVQGAGGGASLVGIQLLKVEEAGYSAIPRRGALRVVPESGVTLRCLQRGTSGTLSAALRSPDGSWTVKRGEQELTFAGLMPGRYQLLWRGVGTKGGQNLELGAADEVTVHVQADGKVAW